MSASSEWMRTPSMPDWKPPTIDQTKPSSARVYDAALGGKDNYAVDRAVVEQIRKLIPESRDVVLYNRAILRRGVRFLAGQAGIRQFIDLGSGLPTVQNTHQVAQAIEPTTRVAYVDNDPIVLAHGRALLADNEYTTVVTADLRDPEAVLGHPDLGALIDVSEPFALMLVAVVHHLNDDEDPHGIVAAYKDALPSGSYLFLTHLCASSPAALAMQDILLHDLGTGRVRTLEEIEAFFDGLDLIDPGVVFLPHWRPDEPVVADAEKLTVAQRALAGGIARKP